jgi:hypothetical protein
MIPSGVKVFLASHPVDFRNYAERTVMQSPRRNVAAAAAFLVDLTPHNPTCV